MVKSIRNIGWRFLSSRSFFFSVIACSHISTLHKAGWEFGLCPGPGSALEYSCIPSHNNHIVEVFLFFPFWRWANQGLERVRMLVTYNAPEGICGTEIQPAWNLHSLFHVLDTSPALNYKIYSTFKSLLLFFKEEQVWYRNMSYVHIYVIYDHLNIHTQKLYPCIYLIYVTSWKYNM